MSVGFYNGYLYLPVFNLRDLAGLELSRKTILERTRVHPGVALTGLDPKFLFATLNGCDHLLRIIERDQLSFSRRFGEPH